MLYENTHTHTARWAHTTQSQTFLEMYEVLDADFHFIAYNIWGMVRSEAYHD